MKWYNSLILIGIIIGLLLAFFGSYHGRKKSGEWGLILILSLLILRTSIWFASFL